MRRLIPAAVVLVALATVRVVIAQTPPSATTGPAPASLPNLKIDSARRQVRLECEALDVTAPLEFLCVLAGTSEHEAALRTRVKPSDLHTALLILGLEPGEPVRYSESLKKWLPPSGPPLRLSVEFDSGGKGVSMPAGALLKDVKSGAAMPATAWVFTGSRTLDDGRYAADLTGYVVSLVNFDLTVIDIPEVASSDNETLVWMIDPAKMPPRGTPVVLVVEPVGDAGPDATGAEPAPDAAPSPASPDLSGPPVDPQTNLAVPDDLRLAALESRWRDAVRPHNAAIREAAQVHYDVIASLRREQQRLINDADHIERLIRKLEAEYQDLTTPRPEP